MSKVSMNLPALKYLRKFGHIHRSDLVECCQPLEAIAGLLFHCDYEGILHTVLCKIDGCSMKTRSLIQITNERWN